MITRSGALASLSAATSVGVGRLPRLRAFAQVAPVALLDVDAVVLGGFLDVGERQVAVGVGDALDLIEAGQGVPDVGRVRQRLLALLGKGEDALGQVAPLRQITVLRMWFPRGMCCHQNTSFGALSLRRSAVTRNRTRRNGGGKRTLWPRRIR